MGTFIITVDGTDQTVSAWSQDDAVSEFIYNADPRREGNDSKASDWDRYMALIDDIEQWIESGKCGRFAIRAATVRETLRAADIDATNHHVVSVGNVQMSTTVKPYYETREVLVFSGAKINDLQGDDPLHVANYRALDRDSAWSDYRSAQPYWDADYYALDMDDTAPGDLVDVINGLADYPCLDDELMSIAEQELSVEHWDSYGLSDALAELARQSEADELDLRDSDAICELLQSITFGGYELDCYPEYIDVSGFNFSAAYVASNAIRLVNAWLAAEQSN